MRNLLLKLLGGVTTDKVNFLTEQFREACDEIDAHYQKEIESLENRLAVHDWLRPNVVYVIASDDGLSWHGFYDEKTAQEYLSNKDDSIQEKFWVNKIIMY